MFALKWKGGLKGLKKSRRVLMCLVLFGILGSMLACTNSGTNSTTSSSGTSGTGTGWTVTVQKFANTLSLSKSETTTVIVTVKDKTGAAAPKNTRICLSISSGAIWVDELGKDTPVTTGCVPTGNDIGQLMGTYVPPTFTGTFYVEVSSMGGFGSTTIEVVP
jgi:hypothetical protein